MKPFQRFIHFLVMKNVVPRFGKRDTSSFMDLTYMDHLMARRLVNLPRVMMRHMSYVISMKDHELPYGDWLTMVFEEFGVPLVDKKGEEPKRYDYFEETFLTMCKLKRENGVWWVGTGENRRRDDEIDAQEEEAEEEEEDQTEFDWEAVIDEAAEQGESGSDDQFFDAQVDVEEPMMETQATPADPRTIHSLAEGDRNNRSRLLVSLCLPWSISSPAFEAHEFQHGEKFHALPIIISNKKPSKRPTWAHEAFQQPAISAAFQEADAA
ncbi:hypothetical protein Dimus_011210 [Dionaea muscipula]